jgi:protein O-GlcNAc transferase
MEQDQGALGIALSLMQRGSMERAFEMTRALLETSPYDPELLNLAGACCFGMGHRAEAVAYWEHAVLKQPDFAMAYNNLGVVLHELGRHAESEAAFRRALDNDPELAEANNNLGSLLLATGRLAQGEAAFRRALASRSDYPEAWRNLAIALQKLHRLAEAEVVYRNLVDAQPYSSQACNDFGVVLTDMGRLAEAEAVFRRALDISPENAMVHANLANVLCDMDRSDEAVGAALRSIELNPNQANTYVTLAFALDRQNSGDLSGAIAAYRRAIELDPDCLVAYSNLAFTLPFVSDNGYEILEECKRLAARFEAPVNCPDVSYANHPSPHRRLRIGYISPDFRDHCQRYYMTPLLRHHDHNAYEIWCYSSVRKPDGVTRQLECLADVWRDVCELSDEDLGTQISADQIDVLVDLTMHMKDGRPRLFARRPAPVQVTWLAYPGTTGSNAIGYRLTDPWLDPLEFPDADARYTERSIRMPDTFWCFDPLVTGVCANGLPADRNGHVTFGCLNNPRKLTDQMIRMWASVLVSLPRSKMILLVGNGVAREQVSLKFHALGVDRSRLSYVSHQPRDEYLRTYQRIDIALDTFPYNGHTTSLDGLWMGVPVVTIIGTTAVARGGYSLLSNLDLPDLAARSEEEFVQISVRLARDLPRLRKLRSSLRTRLEQSPLMDHERFSRGIEQAYRGMWMEWCRQQSGSDVTGLNHTL